MRPRSIGENMAKFQETRDARFLVNAGWLIWRQGRTTELLYGAYCALAHGPLPVSGRLGDALMSVVQQFEDFNSSKQGLSREALIEAFGEEFAVRSLPDDFGGARVATVVRAGHTLLIGEYSSKLSARIAAVGRDSCFVEDYYSRLPGVWHIHLVHGYGTPGKVLITTGDSRKVLDVWALDAGRPRLVERLKARLAGYSAAATIGGKVYLGTDFSCRPNYIETLDGKKYFFPRKAYTKYAVSFTPVMDRYIFSVNADLKPMGGREALSVFDTVDERFVYCEYLEPPA